jgi:hypothetical protein
MPNHWQIINLGFEAQPRNLHSSSPCARCRPHTVLPDISIAWPPSIRPVRPSLVLCTRSPTSVTILIAAHHAAPATCTPRDKWIRFSKRNKDNGKTNKPSRIWIQTSASQWLITIKQMNWPLGFSSIPLISYEIITTNKQLLISESHGYSNQCTPCRGKPTNTSHAFYARFTYDLRPYVSHVVHI